MRKKEIDHLKDVSKQVKEIRHMVEREEKMLARQLKPVPTIRQQILQWILNVFGTVYVVIEQFVEYHDDDFILGMSYANELMKKISEPKSQKINLPKLKKR